MAISSSTSAEDAAGRKPAVTESWWEEARAVFLKDLRSEWRSKAAIGTILIFSLTTMILVSFTVKLSGLGLDTGLVSNLQEAVLREERIFQPGQTLLRAELVSALYWIILYFSAMTGLPRVFAKEEELRTGALLRLTGRPSPVLAGKTLFNLLLLEGVSLLLLPLLLLFFQPQVAHRGLLLAHVVAGAAAIAGASALLGAMVARAGNRGYLMVILGFGPLLPILVLSINGTTAALHGTPGNNLPGLVSYLVVMEVVSWALFDRIWRA